MTWDRIFGMVSLLVVVGAVAWAVLTGDWEFLGLMVVLAGALVAYDRLYAGRKLRRQIKEDEEAARLMREGPGSDFTTPTGSGG